MIVLYTINSILLLSSIRTREAKCLTYSTTAAVQQSYIHGQYPGQYPRQYPGQYQVPITVQTQIIREQSPRSATILPSTPRQPAIREQTQEQKYCGELLKQQNFKLYNENCIHNNLKFIPL